MVDLGEFDITPDQKPPWCSWPKCDCIDIDNPPRPAFLARWMVWLGLVLPECFEITENTTPEERRQERQRDRRQRTR